MWGKWTQQWQKSTNFPSSNWQHITHIFPGGSKEIYAICSGSKWYSRSHKSSNDSRSIWTLTHISLNNSTTHLEWKVTKSRFKVDDESVYYIYQACEASVTPTREQLFWISESSSVDSMNNYAVYWFTMCIADPLVGVCANIITHTRGLLLCLIFAHIIVGVSNMHRRSHLPQNCHVSFLHHVGS